MNYHEYELENGKACKCGYEFKINDMTTLQRVSEKDLFSGIVKHVSETACPSCGRKTLLFLKQQGQTYAIKAIAQKELKNIEENNIISNKDEAEELKISSEAVDTSDNEITCTVCGRSFKNKSGLANHMKVHQ